MEYVRAVEKGELPHNHEIMRQVQNLAYSYSLQHFMVKPDFEIFCRFALFPIACRCWSRAGSDQSSTHRFSIFFQCACHTNVKRPFQCNDVALMALLGSVMKSANNLNQFVNKFNTVVPTRFSTKFMLFDKIHAGLSEAGDGTEDEGHFLLRLSSSVFVTITSNWSPLFHANSCEDFVHHREHNFHFIDSPHNKSCHCHDEDMIIMVFKAMSNFMLKWIVREVEENGGWMDLQNVSLFQRWEILTSWRRSGKGVWPKCRQCR